jgi:hypothetical protein
MLRPVVLWWLIGSPTEPDSGEGGQGIARIAQVVADHWCGSFLWLIVSPNEPDGGEGGQGVARVAQVVADHRRGSFQFWIAFKSDRGWGRIRAS